MGRPRSDDPPRLTVRRPPVSGACTPRAHVPRFSTRAELTSQRDRCRVQSPSWPEDAQGQERHGAVRLRSSRRSRRSSAVRADDMAAPRRRRARRGRACVPGARGPSPRSCPARPSGRRSRGGSGRCGGRGRSPGPRPPGSTTGRDEDVVRLGEVEPEAPALSEIRNTGAPPHGRRAMRSPRVARRPVEVLVRDALLLHSGPDDRENPVNWENTSARWPSSASSPSCSTRASTFADGASPAYDSSTSAGSSDICRSTVSARGWRCGCPGRPR